MHTLDAIDVFALAHTLVKKWGAAYYAAEKEGRDVAAVNLDGETLVQAVARWHEMAFESRGLLAVPGFAAAAEAFLVANAELGRAERRMEIARDFEVGIAIGRAQRDVEVTAVALHVAAPQAPQGRVVAMSGPVAHDFLEQGTD